MARSLGMATIQWNVDPRDWALPGVNAIVANVLANCPQRLDRASSTSAAARATRRSPRCPRRSPRLRRRGYRFVSVAQMLGYKLIYK